MTFWMRAATLQIGPLKYSLDDMNFGFEVDFEDNVKLCTAKVTIYNLSENTRNGIKRGQPLIINAGYEDDMGLVFVGEIGTANSKKQNVDWITEIKATAALDAWLNKEVNKTYKKAISGKDMISDLLNIFGIEVGVFELAVNKVYPRGRVCKGKIKDVLQELVVRDGKSRLLIKNNQLIINDPEKGIKSGYLLSPGTGLLRSAEDKDETETLTSLDTQKTTRQKKQEPPKKKVECLLNHHLGVADEIKVRSLKLNGNYIIVRGSHKGDRAGEWKTTLELKPA